MKETSLSWPYGTLCETGALLVIRDGEAYRYERAMLLTFEAVEQLQQALENRVCAWQFQNEAEQDAS